MPRASRAAAGEAIGDWPGRTHLLCFASIHPGQVVWSSPGCAPSHVLYMALSQGWLLQLLLENHLAGEALPTKSAESLSTGSPLSPTPSVLGHGRVRVLHMARPARGLCTGDVSTLTERGQVERQRLVRLRPRGMPLISTRLELDHIAAGWTRLIPLPLCLSYPSQGTQGSSISSTTSDSGRDTTVEIGHGCSVRRYWQKMQHAAKRPEARGSTCICNSDKDAGARVDAC